MKEKYYDYVKRLGQHHLAKWNSDGVTLCDMPMLGNNYAQHMPKDQWEPCEKCHQIKEVLDGKDS